MIRRLVQGTALVAGCLITVVLVVALGGGLLLVPVSIGALSWAAVSSYRGTGPVTTPGPAGAVPDLPVPSGSVQLTTGQLCVAWEMSGALLSRALPGAERDQIVALRRRYLDELERRDPDGFRRWLDAGSAWGDEPGRYLDGGGGPTTTTA